MKQTAKSKKVLATPAAQFATTTAFIYFRSSDPALKQSSIGMPVLTYGWHEHGRIRKHFYQSLN